MTPKQTRGGTSFMLSGGHVLGICVRPTPRPTPKVVSQAAVLKMRQVFQRRKPTALGGCKTAAGFEGAAATRVWLDVNTISSRRGRVIFCNGARATGGRGSLSTGCSAGGHESVTFSAFKGCSLSSRYWLMLRVARHFARSTSFVNAQTSACGTPDEVSG